MLRGLDEGGAHFGGGEGECCPSGAGKVRVGIGQFEVLVQWK